MEITCLLAEISAINDKYDMLYRRTGGYFNIFNVLAVEDDEVKICRFMSELLNPMGSHCQGTLYLRKFFENVLEMSVPDNLENIRIHREYVTNEGRRIDIVIENENGLFIPIEVKIHSGDRKSQCSDYAAYASYSNMYYLTLDGRCPTKESSHGLKAITNENSDIIGYDGIRQISFKTHIRKWLNACISLPETIRIAPIREVLIQFQTVVDNLTGFREGKGMEIADTLAKSSENMKNAGEIYKNFNEARKIMIYRIFKALEERCGYDKLNNEYDYMWNNGEKAEKFYVRKSSTYPGISFKYKYDQEKDCEIWVRVEIDWRIYIGYCASEKGRAVHPCIYNVEEAKKLGLPAAADFGECTELLDWWISWELLGFGNNENDDTPNFKEPNSVFYDLYDEDKFNTYIEKIVKRISEYMGVV